MSKYLSIILCTLLGLSISLNILFIIPYRNDIFPSAEPEYWTTKDSDSLIIESVLHKSLELAEAESTITIYRENEGLFPDLIYFIFSLKKNKTQDEAYGYPIGYLLAGLSSYVLKTQDENTGYKLIKLSRRYIDNNGILSVPINKVDQVPMGLYFLNLYQYTEDSIYLKPAEAIYNWLERNKGNDNIIYYRSQLEEQYVDCLGMIVPFLEQYARIAGEKKAHSLAVNTLFEYNKKGIDSATGLPFHAYNRISGFHLGSANWGRGIGWYLLAASYIPEFQDPILEESVLSCNSYFQFPYAYTGHFDSSVALLFEMYKKQKINFTSDLSFIKPYITKEGYVDSMSGDTYGMNDYSHSFRYSELVNGLFLLYLSI